MNKHHSYEEWGLPRAADRAVLLEVFRGQDIVGWYGNIERQLRDMVERYRKDRNAAEADQIDQFLTVWRHNQITGSINRSTVAALEAAASVLSAGKLKSAFYFGTLRDNLRRIIASEEELPRIPTVTDSPMGGGGGRRSIGTSLPSPSAAAGKPKPDQEPDSLFGPKSQTEPKTPKTPKEQKPTSADTAQELV